MKIIYDNCRLFLIFLMIVIGAQNSFGQTSSRFLELEESLDSLAQDVAGLNELTNISMRGVSLAEYIRSIGVEHKINVYIEDTPNTNLTNNLTNESIKSVFIFVCRQFNYTIEISGSILIFKPYLKPKEEVVILPKELDIAFTDGKISLDLKQDSLFPVIKRISELTGKKIITRPGSEGLLTAFLPPTSLDTALEALFMANGFKIASRKKGYYIVQPTLRENQPSAAEGKNENTNSIGRTDFLIETYKDADTEYITLDAQEADLQALIETIFTELESNYLIYENIVGTVTIGAEITELDDLLKYLLQGTNFTYKKDGDLYLIGPSDLEGLNTTKIVRMKYRPTYQAIDLIPGVAGSSGGASQNQQGQNRQNNQTRNNNLNNSRNNNFTRNNSNQNNFNNSNNYNQSSLNGGFNSSFNQNNNQAFTNSQPPEIIKTEVEGVQIVEYPELNRIILKGPTNKVDDLALFLTEIDQPVPMVRIEMVVVEVNKSRVVSTGIRSGLRAPGDSVNVNKEVLPGVDYTLDGSELNAILSNVPVLSNIGTLKSNFYFQLRAQESRGDLKIRMEPVLSMLNGREATLTIGQTQYYLLETQTASNGAVNNYQQFTQRFERIDANINLSIKPYISEDEMVTLDVIPDFTTPVGSFDSNVPPTIATRRFSSTIRVKHGETVILGGLTQDETRENTKGLPVLSRIPILKWFFGNVDKNKSESSLLIYITPEIFYY